MRSSLLALITMITLFLGFWAYQQNYETRKALKESQQVTQSIHEARERLNMLKAEWHYLNRPSRLKRLVNMNFQKLGLQVLRPQQIKTIDDLREKIE